MPAESNLEALEQKVSNQLANHDAAYTNAFFRYGADIQALGSLICEIAERLGVSRADFEECFRERAVHFLHAALARLEQTKPARAAELDNRTIDEVPTAAGFRPLFLSRFPDKS